MQESFDIAEIRDREWAKRTSKTPLAIDLDWDVLEKTASHYAPAPKGQPVVHATFALRAEHPEGQPPGSWFPRGPSELVVTADYEDLTYFIRTLERLRSAMTASRKGDAT